MILEPLCISVPQTVKKDKEEVKQHVVFLDFDTINKRINRGVEEVNAKGNDSGKEYLWVGNNKGNKPQLYFTTDNLEYLLTRTLPNIRNRVEGDLKKDLESVIKEFFNKVGSEFYIKPDKIFDDVPTKIKEIEDEIKSSKKPKEIKGAIKKLINEEEKHLLLLEHLEEKQVALYSTKIDGKLACKYKEYAPMILYEKVEQLFDDKGEYRKTYKKKEPVLYVVKRKHLPLAIQPIYNLNFILQIKLAFRPTWTDNLPKTTASVKIVTDVS